MFRIDQRKLLLWLQICRSDNVVLQTMSMLNRNEFIALYSKYSCNAVMMPGKIKNMIWDKLLSLVSFKNVLLVFTCIIVLCIFIVLYVC